MRRKQVPISSVQIERILVALAAFLFLLFELRLATVTLDHRAVEIVGGFDQGGAYRLAGRGFLRVAEIAPDAVTEVSPEADGLVGTAALHRAREHHLGSLRIDYAQVDRHIRLGLPAAEAKARDVEAAARLGRVFGVRSDAAGHQILRAGDVAGVGSPTPPCCRATSCTWKPSSTAPRRVKTWKQSPPTWPLALCLRAMPTSSFPTSSRPTWCCCPTPTSATSRKTPCWSNPMCASITKPAPPTTAACSTPKTCRPNRC